MTYLKTRSTIILETEEDKAVWSKLNVWAMSDEESSNEENASRVFRTLPWRTEEATNLIQRCDTTLGIIRNYGDPSTRAPDHRCSGFLRIDYDNEEFDFHYKGDERFEDDELYDDKVHQEEEEEDWKSGASENYY